MRKSLVLTLAMFMVIGFSSLAAAALTFNLDFGQDGAYENNWDMNLDDTVYINMYVSDVPSPLISIGMDITYNKDQLKVTTLGIGVSATNWHVSPQVDLSTPGSIIMKGSSVNGLEGDNIFLGTIGFHCIAPGLSEIRLYDSDRQGSFNDFVLVDNTVLDRELADGILLANINNVPIPGGLILLGSGLIGLIGLGRRRIKKS